MKKYKGFIAGVIVGVMLASLPIFADSYTRAIDAVVNFTNVQINGADVQSDNMLIDDKTYVWIRDVADMLDLEIVWDEATNTANLVDKNSVEHTAMRINGVNISDRTLKAYKSVYSVTDNDILINNVTEMYIIGSKTEKYGLGTREDYLKKSTETVDNYIAANGTAFTSYLDSMGITKEDYSILLADNNMYTDVLNAMYENMQSEMQLDDSILRERYNANPNNYGIVTTKHILVEDLKTASDIYKKLQNGEDFDKLMAEYSIDTGSKYDVNGFSFTKGEMVPEYEEASFAQEVGTYSAPVKSDYGYHIVYVLDRSESTYENAYSILFDEVFTEIEEQYITEWIDAAEIVKYDDVIGSLQ